MTEQVSGKETGAYHFPSIVVQRYNVDRQPQRRGLAGRSEQNQSQNLQQDVLFESGQHLRKCEPLGSTETQRSNSLNSLHSVKIAVQISASLK